MNVAYNALSLRPGTVGGAATFTLNLLARLPAELPEARFTVYVREGEDRIEDNARLTLKRVNGVGSAPIRILVETIALGYALRRRQPSVLLSPNESIPMWLPCPTVVVAQNLVYHGTESSFLGGTFRQRLSARAQLRYYRSAAARAYRNAAAVIAVTNETARVLTERAGLDPLKTKVVFEGSDSILLPAVSAPALRGDRILVVSTFAPYKGLEQTLEIFRMLNERAQTLELLLVGADWNGYREVIERRVSELGLQHAVHFQAPAEGLELAELYATSRLLLLLSECESFGLPVLEAMSRGLPVVVSDRSSLPEVAGGAALVVDPGNPVRAADAIGSLLDSQPSMGDYARQGLVRSAELTWQQTAEGIAEVLKEVAAVDRSRRAPKQVAI